MFVNYYSLIADLSLADLERGFFAISSLPAVIGFFVRIFMMFSLDFSFKKFFTILSSAEWNEIIANLAPLSRTSVIWGKTFFKFSSSLFVAILNAWKTLVAKWIFPN